MNTKDDILKNIQRVTKQLSPTDFHYILFPYNGCQWGLSTGYWILLNILCSAKERNSCRFGSWGWVNYERILTNSFKFLLLVTLKSEPQKAHCRIWAPAASHKWCWKKQVWLQNNYQSVKRCVRCETSQIYADLIGIWRFAYSNSLCNNFTIKGH